MVRKLERFFVQAVENVRNVKGVINTVAKTFSMKPPIALAVIGAGHWGKNLIRNFYELGVLKLICDKNEALLSKSQAKYAGVQVCLALNDVLSRPDIDAVAVASPAETHSAIAKEALMAGKHVFVEKPLALEEKCAKEVNALSIKLDRVLMVGHLLQYHPVFLKLKQMIKNGDLGRINYIYSHRLNLGKIRREENILWSFAPHDISMILSLAGKEPDQVMATSGNYLHKNIADVTTTHLEFATGLKAHIFVSWLHPFKEQKMVVVGDEKMAVFDDTAPWSDKLLLYNHEINWKNNIPIPARAEPERLAISGKEPLKSECEHFLHCIRSGETPRTDGLEGLRVLKVLKASQRSLDNKSEWIRINRNNHSNGVLSESNFSSYHAHPTAVIDDNVTIGNDTRIWHFSHIIDGSVVGQRCNIGQNVVIGPDASVGDGCKIQNNVSLYKGVTLEDGVFCGPSVVFTNVHNPRAHIKRMSEAQPTLVRKGATLGANCTIVCGNTIGSYAFVGAGSVVTKNIPDHALVVGNPAKRVGWVCECATRLDHSFTCNACGKVYDKQQGRLTEQIQSV